MPIDIPKHIRAEAQRAEFYVELVKRADRLNSLEQAEAESLALIEKNRQEAQRVIDDANKVLSQAKETEAAARAKAEVIISDALKKTAADQAQARAAAIAERTAIEAETERAKGILAEVNAKLATAKQAHSEVMQAVADTSAKAAEAQAKLDSLRAIIKQKLEG